MSSKYKTGFERVWALWENHTKEETPPAPKKKLGPDHCTGATEGGRCTLAFTVSAGAAELWYVKWQPASSSHTPHHAQPPPRQALDHHRPRRL